MNAFLLSFINESYKSVLSWWYFKTNTFVRPLTFAMQFAGLMFVYFRGGLHGEGLDASLAAYCFWTIGFFLLADSSWNMIDEMQAGTLEQLYMTSMPISFLWISRMIGSLIVAVLNILVILLVLKIIFGISFFITPAILLIFIFMIPNLFGLALILTGLTFTVKRTEALVGFMHNALVYLSGAIVPLVLFPAQLKSFAIWLPGTLGINLMRDTITEHMTIKDLLIDGRIFIVLIHALIVFAIGALFFNRCQKSLRKNGNYGIY